MKFKKITFSNYRCFVNGSISFVQNGAKNINVLCGLNGGGKTESLYAFWWVLYDFDFSRLTGKEKVPYALNSALYHELEGMPVYSEKSCSVTLEFETDNKVLYSIKRIGDYRKTPKIIKYESRQELSYVNPNGTRSLPERDPDNIKKILNKFIPKSILYGIMFDGERMQKLTSTNEASVGAIRSVVNDITNVELLENASLIFQNIKNTKTKYINKKAKELNKKDLETINNDIESLEKRKTDLQRELDELRAEYDSNENQKAELSAILENSKESQELERKRNEAKDTINKEENALKESYKNLSSVLLNGYILISDKVLDEVDEIIEKYDIPQDLTVPAVKSILTRPQCICGRAMDSFAINKLTELISNLPPDNVNSTLLEIVRQLRNKKGEIKEQAKIFYDDIKKHEDNIRIAQENIASISTQLSNIQNVATNGKTIQQINDEYIALRERFAVIKFEIPRKEEELSNVESNLKDLNNDLSNHSTGDDEIDKINREVVFLNKAIRAIEAFKGINKHKALSILNEKLAIAYKQLSEDYSLGRRIYLVQYDALNQYSIVTYLNSDLELKLKELANDSLTKQSLYAEIDNEFSSKLMNYSEEIRDEIVKEKLILQISGASSTGQGKMNSFAFIKAILDYSCLEKGDDGIEIVKEYPLVVDAPFSDIAGQNLVLAAKMLPEFSSQIILMIDDDKYKDLKQYFGANVSNMYHFDKTDNKNESSITKVEV